MVFKPLAPSLSFSVVPFTMTGMRMRCMDRKPHHAKGIVPDKIVTVYANDYLIYFDRILNLALNVR